MTFLGQWMTAPSRPGSSLRGCRRQWAYLDFHVDETDEPEARTLGALQMRFRRRGSPGASSRVTAVPWRWRRIQSGKKRSNVWRMQG